MPAHPHDAVFEQRIALFCEKVRVRAEEIGLSQHEFARQTGVSRGYLRLIWHGRGAHTNADTSNKVANPTLAVVYKIADALDVSVEYLVGNEPVKRAEQRG